MISRLLVVCAAMNLATGAAFADSSLENNVKKMLKPYGNRVSFSLRDLNGRELFNVNGSTPLAPASVAKLVSTACGLWALEPQHQFETVFGYRGKIEKDTLKGDLVIAGNGDPSLVIEDLREVIEKLRYLHDIKTIEGDLVFDVSYLGSKGLEIAAGFEGDAGRSFTALLTATPMNQNSFSFWVVPPRPGDKSTRALTLPANVLDIRLNNQARLGGDGISVAYDPSAKSATISGGVSAGGEPKGLYRSVPDTYDYYTRLIQRLWKDAGGNWKQANYKIETQPVKSTLLWKHTSKALSRILMDINKLSLNFGAELVFLAAGAEKKGKPASFEKSMAMLNECLAEFKVPAGSIVMTNASGLSRETQVQSSALTRFLMDYYQSAYGPEYLSSLSLLGRDGTARSRLTKFAGRGRLKTGTLRDVRSVAGYLYSKGRQPFAFSLIFNGVSMSDQKVKALEDKVIETVLEADLGSRPMIEANVSQKSEAQ
ncbi:MAG TPA: D-alanyl-D-alanine carboxypeptidase/D-alanyl-D-alanine-endopeptidase [Bdellovibrionales bacterium]|nr:D-alanyl-D-alanine carboxypeptidase/D-alanyl-D-alanine-endopeptidase [Bdellovibrionales bacterium]